MAQMSDANTSKKTEKTKWYLHEEADTTIRVIGGLLFAYMVFVALFILELRFGSPGQPPVYLKEHVVTLVIGAAGGWVGGVASRRNNGGQHR